MIKRIGC